MDYDNPQFIAAIKKILRSSDAPKSQDDSTKHKGNSPHGLAASVDVSPVSPADPPPPGKHADTDNGENPMPWWKKLDTYRFIAELAILVVTVRIACIYSSQLNAMLDSNTINRNASVSARQSADDALSQAKDQFRTDQRPYIGLSIAGWTAYSYLVNEGPHKGHIAVTLTYANYGKSPAIHLRYNGFVAIGDKAPSRVRLHEITDTTTGIIVPPGETKGTVVCYSEDVVTPEKFTQMQVKKPPMIFFGHFEYADLFGDPKPPYTTEFCMATTPNIILGNDSFKGVCDAHSNMR